MQMPETSSQLTECELQAHVTQVSKALTGVVRLIERISKLRVKRETLQRSQLGPV